MRIGRGLFLTAAALVLTSMVPGGAAKAQTGPTTTDSEIVVSSEVPVDRDALAQGILDTWMSVEMSVNLKNEGLLPDLEGALRNASTEQLLAAAAAQTPEDLAAAIEPAALGDVSADLVYTPVTPCRIVDTRLGVAPYTGLLGPNEGYWFSVTGPDYSNQGGVATGCGIPTSPNKPAAIMVNLASTGQTGNGNLKIVGTYMGNPTAVLLNYMPGVTTSNAGAVQVAQIVGEEMWIYSGNARTHAIVDIMGYFSRPVATAVDNNVLNTSLYVAAGAHFDIFSPTCPAGWRLTGGGFLLDLYDSATIEGSRPAVSGSYVAVAGVNSANAYLCQGTNRVAQNIYCFSICSRVPGK